MQVVVWNVDARNRPELEVEIEIVTLPAEIPGEHLARRTPELEVELVTFEDHDGWFLDDDDLVALDDYTVYDSAPHGYAAAYALAG